MPESGFWRRWRTSPTTFAPAVLAKDASSPLTDFTRGEFKTVIGETGAESGVILRQAPFWGPDEGPYSLWGLETVPGEMIPISPGFAVVVHASAAALLHGRRHLNGT